MRGFHVFCKKEIMELCRTYRVFLLGAVALIFGILSPLIAKLTPWLMEQYADTFREQGIVVGQVTVTAKDSWAQFDKNFMIVLIVGIAIFSGSYVNEYAKGTLIPLVTKGLTRTGMVLSKLLTQLLAWTVYFVVTFGITWGYTAYFWDSSEIKNVLWMGLFFWMMGVFLLTVLAFFSSFMNSSIQVLLGVGGVYVLLTTLGMIRSVESLLPTYLMGSAALLTGEKLPGDYAAAAGVTGAVSVVLVLLAVVITRRRKL